MRSTFTKSITALILVIAMAVGMTASLGGKAKAATPINIAYAAGDDAKINGGPVCNVTAYAGVATTITRVKPVRSGYEFLGWSTIKNSGIVQYYPGQSVTFKKNTTLWPVWDTKCTILYLKDESETPEKFQKGTLAFHQSLLGYLSKRVTKLSTVSPKAFGSFREFINTWNNMPNEQAVVIIFCHGFPTELWFRLSIYEVNNDLQFKNIKAIILVACNCGHLEHYDRGGLKSNPQNIAEAFAKRFKCVVYASDGDVSLDTKLVSGMYDWKYFNKKGSTRTQNSGWLVYDGRNNKSGAITPTILGFRNGTTIAGLLDAYYSKHYSW